MARFPHGGEILGAAPANPMLEPVLRPGRDLNRQQALLDLQAIQRIPGLAGYWSADPSYLWEDSGGTTPASLNGVVGRWSSLAPAIQATTAVKPYLRRTPTTGVYWLDSNTSTSALTATLGNLGTSCTIARAGAEGVTFTEGVTISSTYNIAPAFGFNADIAIFNRALTATEKALLTRYMQRGVPVLGANLIVNGTFDTNTASWTPTSNTLFEQTGGWGRLTNNGSNYRNASQSILTTGKFYFAKSTCRGDGVSGIPRIRIGNALPYSQGTTSATEQLLTTTGSASTELFYVINNSTTASGVYADFDNVACQEIL